MRVDLEMLAKHVEGRGGLDAVQKGDLWAAVAGDLGIDLKECTNGLLDVASCVKRLYLQCVLAAPRSVCCCHRHFCSLPALTFGP